MNKSHLFFRNPVEGVKKYSQPTRYISSKSDEEETTPKNYIPMRDVFNSSLINFRRLKSERDNNRNRNLNIPATIDYIVIKFFNYFDSAHFENRYRTNFGLVPIRYEDFNTIGFFAVYEQSLFQNFLRDIQTFIDLEDPINSDDFNHDILFMQSFSFHSSSDIKQFQEPKELFIFNLFDSIDLFTSKFLPIVKSLESYLSERDINFSTDVPSNKIEIYNAHNNTIQEIIDNFDIIHTVNSPLAGIIRPSLFNMPVREFGFEITNSNDDLPIIGIIDTGISDQTPLAPLIINEANEFDITGTNPKIDNADHGTGVAALAALGKSLYPVHIGQYTADAKLLSIKVLDDAEGQISEMAVISSIRSANHKYGVKIFVLTLGYINPLSDNSNISNYALSLDSLANELDILILISTGNISDIINYMYKPASNHPIAYPNHYKSPDYNISSPADSMNNISCGAVSDNLEPFDNSCYARDKNYPASYSRKLNLNRRLSSFRSSRFSKHLMKPDCCCSAGDYADDTSISNTGLKVLSSRTGYYFDRSVGTSYSAPLLANLAAKLLKTYPALSNNIQTVKALILNSTFIPATGNLFENLDGMKLTDFIGKGIPDDFYSIYSDENLITLILEDSIFPEEIKAYSIQLPNYLQSLPHKKGILEVKATLCFKFEPVPHNHLTYCPIHMAFGIFKNVPLESDIINSEEKLEHHGINGSSTTNFVFKESWSQDYYFKPKLLSNAQKMSFNISKQDLINESNEFKITINSKFHKLLNPIQKEEYNLANNFSLVISIREKPIANKISNNLYNEMILINDLEVITELEAEIEL